MPNSIPAMVDKIMIIEQKTAVFFTPITLPITSMFGKDNAGPARSKAKAGPLPIPSDISDCMIGTSVRVAKYMNAPTMDAKKLAKTEFPPTRSLIHELGIIPAICVSS